MKHGRLDLEDLEHRADPRRKAAVTARRNQAPAPATPPTVYSSRHDSGARAGKMTRASSIGLTTKLALATGESGHEASPRLEQGHGSRRGDLSFLILVWSG